MTKFIEFTPQNRFLALLQSLTSGLLLCGLELLNIAVAIVAGLALLDIRYFREVV
jgi:hypothetical protein